MSDDYVSYLFCNHEDIIVVYENGLEALIYYKESKHFEVKNESRADRFAIFLTEFSKLCKEA
jgi:hypothetical protein